MPRFFKNRSSTKGLAPGSLIFIGNKKMEKSQITLIDYDEKNLSEKNVTNLDDLRHLKELPTVSWINIYGIHEIEIIQQIGEIFDITPLLLEDILNTDQRPKFEERENSLGFILKVLQYNKNNTTIQVDQISFILGKNFVISFQEQQANFFDPIRERIRNSKGRLRISGADYLIYVLLDTIVDNYLEVIGLIGEQIEEVGKRIITVPENKLAREIYNLKIEINILRKYIRPVKEMILLWLKSENSLVSKKNKSYLTDLADLITQAEENIEIYDSLLIDGLNIYNTNLSNKANQIMKVLTIFAAIFIPLTFLAGIYGMNFKYMPELNYRYSYPIFWLVIITVSTILLLLFIRKKWL